MPYATMYPKDPKLVKNLLKLLDPFGDGEAQLQAAALNMLRNDWGGPNSSIGLLSSQINKWRQAKAPAGPLSEEEEIAKHKNGW